MSIFTRFAVVCLLLLLGSLELSGQTYISTYSPSAGQPYTGGPTSDATTTGYTRIVEGPITSPNSSWHGPFTLPFQFQFFSTIVTDYYVSDNGLLTFSTPTGAPPSGNNVALPTTQLPDNTIAALWDEPNSVPTGGNDDIWVRTYGTAPNRQFVVFWFSYAYGEGGSSTSFNYIEIVLEETTNNVIVVEAYNNSNVESSTIGVQENATSAVQYSSTHDAQGKGVSPTDNDQFVFTFFNPQPNDAGLVDFPGLGASNCGDSTQVIPVRVFNQGTDPMSNVPIELTLSGIINQTVTQTISGPIASGDSITLFFGPFNTYAGGTLNLDAIVNWPSDQNATNDALSAVLTLDDNRPGPLPSFKRDTTICDSFPIVLQGITDGTPGVELVWYDEPTGGTPDGVGNFYITSTLSQTDTFYVAQRQVFTTSGGPTTPGSGSDNVLTSNDITFDVVNPISLDSVLLFVEDDGTFTLTITDPGGNTIFTGSQTFSSTGQFFFPIGVQLTPGTGYVIDMTGSVDLFELPTTTLLPIDVAGFLTITSTSTSFTDGLVLFDWHLSNISCPTTLQPFIVNVEIPNLELGPDTTICAPYVLNAFDPNAVSYAWSNGETDPVVSVNTTEQPLSVTVTTTNGCVATDEVNIIAPGNPTFPPQDTIEVCGFWQPAPGNLDPSQDFTWSNGSTSSNPTISTTGTISVSVTNGCGATLTDEWFIEVEPGPVFDLGSADTAVCNSNVMQLSTGLTGAPTNLHSWTSSAGNNPGSGPSITAAAPTPGATLAETVTYTVTVSEPGGCVATDSITVVYLGTPVVDLGDPIQSSCQFLTFDAGNANSGATYLWNTGATTQTITPNVGGSYGVTVFSDEGCEASDTVFFSKQNPFTVGLGQDTSVCEPVYELTTGLSPSQYTFNWNSGQTFPSIFVGSSGTYGVAVTNTTTGCQVYDEINLVISNVPAVDLGPDQPLCGANLTLSTGINQGTQVWSTGQSGSSISVNSAGVYSVVVTYNCGFESTDTIEVLANTVPTFDITPAQTLSCNPITLATGLTNVDHLWSNGASTPSITVEESGVYSVTVSTPVGCEYGDTTNVVVGEEPVATLQLPDTFAVNADFAVFYTSEPAPTSASWSFGSDALPFANATGLGQKVIGYGSTGVKTVTLTLTNGSCTTTLTGDVVIVDPSTSRKPIHDFAGLVDLVSVYPNPAETHFRIIYNGPLREDLNLDVYDIVGQHIEKYSMTVNPGQVYPIDIQDYAEGLYTLRINIGGQSRYMRILKD